MNQALYLLPLIVGFLIPLQAKFNGRLFEASKDAVLTGLISVSITTLFVGICILALRRPLFLPDVPWWVYLGGVCGAIYVVGASFLAARLPLTVLVTGLLAGQIVMSLILDRLQYGTLSLRQISACILIAVAVFLNSKF